MDIRVLGPLEVERDGRLIDLGGRKPAAVLAVLILHRREVMGVDRLADAVWEGEPPASAETTLRGYVSKLRKALGSDASLLRTVGAGYVLDVDDEQIDAGRFERLVREGRERSTGGDLPGASESWTEALELWRGEAYQDFAYSGFAQAEAGRLTDLRSSCTEELFDVRIELGLHEEVVADLEAFCAANPDRERALGLRMVALYRCGRQSEALRVYEDGRRRLADELGVDPSPELRELHERIVRQDDDLAARERARRPGKQTLTFLLGDVERSTAALRSLGDDYAAVLDEHRRIMREAFAAHGGRAVNTKGDEVFAAFDGATGAVRAAVQAQLALCSSEIPEGRRLPVRMGLDTGEVMFSGDEPVGLAIHVAARVMDAAHGGQILCSQATKELVDGGAVSFADTGAHALKDIPEPVRLFQVVHPELRRDFPPLRTLAARTDNLPNRVKSFVGRDGDLDQVDAMLADARVVTLTGVGGVGKTTLAIEAGQRVGSRYADGAWLCELAPVADADGIVHSLASMLGVEQQPGRSLRESLLNALSQRSSLIVLDNCEHLLTVVAELVEDIVRSSRETDVLATSREALGVDGERSCPVRSLRVTADGGLTPAMRLFEDRAGAVRPDFAIDQRNAADVADICTRLDGIPLAIELAAARVGSLSPAQIATRLEEGFHFLRSGRRAAVDRHRTLHGAIDWSYAMLSEAERLLFDRLSVFAGGFVLEAAEQVCGRDLDLDVADGLASLVAKSMVDCDATGEAARYTLLETMRQYAQDRLAERGESGDVLRAHAVFFADLVEELDDLVRTDSERALARLLAEFDNLRAAHAWARSAGDVDVAMQIVVRQIYFLALHLSEVSVWAEETVAMPGADGHLSLPSALLSTARRAGRRGEVEKRSELVARAREIVDDPDDPRRITVLIPSSQIAIAEGRFEDARHHLSEFQRIAEVASDEPFQAYAYALRSQLESFAGEHATAVGFAEAGYELARTRTTASQGVTLYYLGEALLDAGEDLERAQSCLERSIERFRANQMPFWASVALVAIASLRARHGNPVEALEMFANVIDRWRRIGDWVRQWVTLVNLAELFGRICSGEAAAIVLAAAEASGMAETDVGPQGERLAELRGDLAERLGVDGFARACDRGRAMSGEEAVAYAKVEIERALERSRLEA